MVKRITSSVMDEMRHPHSAEKNKEGPGFCSSEITKSDLFKYNLK